MGQSLPEIKPVHPGLRSRYPVRNKKSEHYVDLGCLGEQVKVEVYYDLCLDYDGYPFIDLRAIYIEGVSLIDSMANAVGLIHFTVRHDIEEAIKEKEDIA